jgi:hypothetical protein
MSHAIVPFTLTKRLNNLEGLSLVNLPCKVVGKALNLSKLSTLMSPGLTTNNELAGKQFPWTNTLAYFQYIQS